MNSDVSPIPEQILKISELKEGWLDGEGVEFDRSVLENVSKTLLRLSEYDIPTPYIYPNPEGSIEVEWPFNSYEVIAEFVENGQVAKLMSINAQTGASVEFSLDVSDSGGDLDFVDFIRKYMK